MNGSAPGSGDSLRRRLSAIPTLEEAPLDPSWVSPVEADPVPDPSDEPVAPRRRRWPLVLGPLMLILTLLIGVPLFLGYRAFESIERVPVGDALAPTPTGTNLLIVGTDSRSGIDDDTENAGLILGGGTEGERSDTIMIIRLADDGSRMMSLPRDLWLTIDGRGPQRINTAIARGPSAVINTVRSELGIPVTHYAQVDLAGFIDLVDAVGGVTITIPHPAFDRASGLDLPTAGDVELDSTQALAYVRSRRYTEVINGSEVTDPTSDLGRVQRQQEFLRALIGELSRERNPLALNEILGSMADAVAIDDRTSFSDAIALARQLRSGLPESVTLPTRGTMIDGNSVLLLGDGAEEVLQQFRG